MKTIAAYTPILFLLGLISAEAQLLYPSIDLRIEWQAKTDALPKKLWIYKSSPNKFSPAAVSNAMVLATFKKEDLSFHPDNDPDASGFRDNKDQFWTRSLDVLPRYGQISYRVRWDLVGPPQGIPSDEKVRKQAWEYVAQLGVKPTELTEKKITARNCERDKSGKQFTNGVCAKDIHLARRIEGIEMRDFGFWLTLGNDSQLRGFTLLWPGLQPFESHPLASTKQISKWIMEAKTYMALEEDGSFDLPKRKKFSKASKLVITKITPIYAEGDVRKYGQIPKDSDERMFSPYGELEGVAEVESEKLNFRVLGPILAMEIGKPVEVFDK